MITCWCRGIPDKRWQFFICIDNCMSFHTSFAFPAFRLPANAFHDFLKQADRCAVKYFYLFPDSLFYSAVRDNMLVLLEQTMVYKVKYPSDDLLKFASLNVLRFGMCINSKCFVLPFSPSIAPHTSRIELHLPITQNNMLIN